MSDGFAKGYLRDEFAVARIPTLTTTAFGSRSGKVARVGVAKLPCNSTDFGP